MKNDKQEHRRCRSDVGFDTHRDMRYSGEMWNDRNWRFTKMNPAAFDPHMREVACAAPAAGRHLGKSRSEARAVHGK